MILSQDLNPAKLQLLKEMIKFKYQELLCLNTKY